MTKTFQRMSPPDDWDFGGPGEGSFASIFLGDGKKVRAVIYGATYPDRSELFAYADRLVAAMAAYNPTREQQTRALVYAARQALAAINLRHEEDDALADEIDAMDALDAALAPVVETI